MSETLSCATMNEARYWLAVTPCPHCGNGPMGEDEASTSSAGGTEPADPTAGSATAGTAGPASAGPADLHVHCAHCGKASAFHLECAHAVGADEPDVYVINPTDQPGKVIDLGQWMSLFYVLIEQAARDADRKRARRTGYRAALCLAEAMKFYRDDDELPPADAFFTQRTRDAFRQHPESFARTRLLGLRGKLPDLSKMADRVRHDRRRRWWQFWLAK